MNKLFSLIVKSPFISGVLTSVANVFYGLVIGVALFPSLVLLFRIWESLPEHTSYRSILLIALACGLGLILFYVWGVIVFGTIVRVLSIGVKAGRYPVMSATMIRWLFYSGLYALAGNFILQMIPISFLLRFFFRIIGAKIGKNVQINTWFLNDAYLLEIGDNVIIGGKTDISCHTFERGELVLAGIKIGSNVDIGQGCYISPGVTIEDNCVIGQYSLVRKNTVVSSRTILSAIAGLPIRQVVRIEKGGNESAQTAANTAMNVNEGNEISGT